MFSTGPIHQNNDNFPYSKLFRMTSQQKTPCMLQKQSFFCSKRLKPRIADLIEAKKCIWNLLETTNHDIELCSYCGKLFRSTNLQRHMSKTPHKALAFEI